MPKEHRKALAKTLGYGDRNKGKKQPPNIYIPETIQELSEGPSYDYTNFTELTPLPGIIRNQQRRHADVFNQPPRASTPSRRNESAATAHLQVGTLRQSLGR